MYLDSSKLEQKSGEGAGGGARGQHVVHYRHCSPRQQPGITRSPKPENSRQVVLALTEVELTLGPGAAVSDQQSRLVIQLTERRVIPH